MLRDFYPKNSIQENIHNRRKSSRLDGYDYRQSGAYFVTICARKMENIFGKITNRKMVINSRGQIAREEWFLTAQIRPNVQLYKDEFVIMPNHIHGIIWIINEKATHPFDKLRTGGSPLQIIHLASNPDLLALSLDNTNRSLQNVLIKSKTLKVCMFGKETIMIGSSAMIKS